MPTKRRTPKRRPDRGEELETWTEVFLFGHDFSGGIEKAGLSAHLGQPDRAAIEEAWQRLGPQFLTTWNGHGDREIWAVRELGDPDAC